MRHLLFLFACLTASPVAAGLDFCNETAEKVIVSIGYSDNKVWTSEGWWHVSPGACKTAVGGDLTTRYYYYRAKSDSQKWGGQKYFFCTDSKAYTIAGDTECTERGYERAEFNQIDTGDSKTFTMTLTGDAPAPAAPKQEAPMPKADAPIGDTAEPGTHGEPYSISGMFSHCEVFDASMQCEIHANGFRYLASSLDPTPLDMLERLDRLATASAIGISGDMISYEGNRARVTIRDFDQGGQVPHLATLQAIQGRWWSVDDAKYEVLIHGGMFEEYYNGMPSETALIALADGCQGFPGDGPAIQLHPLADAEEDRCFFVGQTGPRLELFPAGGMNDLRFERAR